MKFAGLILIVLVTFGASQAQEEAVQAEPQQSVSPLPDEVYTENANAVVKLVSDAGRRIGAGVVLGVHKDGLGFVLTTYSMVAGREKIAVILRDFGDPLLGYIVDRWIDFDLDLAIIAIKNYPEKQAVVTMGDSKAAAIGQTYTVIGHTEVDDWLRLPAEVFDMDERFFSMKLNDTSPVEGAPLLDSEGRMIGLMVSEKAESSEGEELVLAIKSNTLKPILNEWFQPIELAQKWQEPGKGFPTWIWAVGGGVLGGTIATAIAIAGGEDGAPAGLPRPPDPPEQP